MVPALTLEEVLFSVHVGIVCDDVERRPPSHHLKHQHAQRPPVHTETWGEKEQPSDTVKTINELNQLTNGREIQV